MYLVTGGAGFIGSHIVDALVAAGKKVRVLDNLSSGKRENLSLSWDKIDFIEGDIRDRERVEKTMQGVDYVCHQAALRSVPKSMDRPWDYNDVNITGLLNVLIAAAKNNVKKLVFASSSSLYGNTSVFPQSESCADFPISPYALTKKIGEDYCRLFSEIYRLPTVSLRYFNVYGPRQDLENDYAVVIPKFITAALKKEVLPIYGDGTQSRDFTYISDVVNANIAALETEAGAGKAYNAACGKSYRVLELAELIGKILKTEINSQFLPPRSGDIKATQADVEKIEKELGWKGCVDFEQGLRKTIEWYK